MMEVVVTVEYNNQHYLTNVIVDKAWSVEKINCLAKEQVKKQWERQ